MLYCSQCRRQVSEQQANACSQLVCSSKRRYAETRKIADEIAPVTPDYSSSLPIFSMPESSPASVPDTFSGGGGSMDGGGASGDW